MNIVIFFSVLSTNLRKNKKKYFLYKEVSEQVQSKFDYGFFKRFYEGYYKHQYSSFSEYLGKEIIANLLEYDQRIFTKDGEIEPIF